MARKNVEFKEAFECIVSMDFVVAARGFKARCTSGQCCDIPNCGRSPQWPEFDNHCHNFDFTGTNLHGKERTDDGFWLLNVSGGSRLRHLSEAFRLLCLRGQSLEPACCCFRCPCQCAGLMCGSSQTCHAPGVHDSAMSHVVWC